jgi:hypothetical protein
MMKLCFFLIVLCLAGCGVQKPVVTSQHSNKLVIRERLVTKTVHLTTSGVFISERVQDTSSILKSGKTQSIAAIRNGDLYHSLQIDPDTTSMDVSVPVTDTTSYHQETETVYIEVPRQATKWESFLEVCGWIFLGVIALAIIALIVRVLIRFRV